MTRFGWAHSGRGSRWAALFGLLAAACVPAAALAVTTLERPPYLQLARPDAVVLKWRTVDLVDTMVEYGDAPGNLTSTITIPGARTEHEVELTSLTPGARYFYSVGSTTQLLAGADADHWFDASPPVGPATPFRMWIVGDSGRCGQDPLGCTDVGLVKSAYLGFVGTERAQAWLMLGDNAYLNGTDSEYTVGLFEVFPDVLRNSPLWAAYGNHDAQSSDAVAGTGPHFEAFVNPELGEAGGLQSDSEAFYSFDYANVHFVVIDSMTAATIGVGGVMYNWLDADLQATTQDWVIVYFHHPPYSKSNHDSDTEQRLIDMREDYVPLFESRGVDLVLAGHGHSYERSMLIDGHHGLSGTFDPAHVSMGGHVVDGGDGDPDGDGEYRKASRGRAAPNEGAVYMVLGSSSNNKGGLTTHPAMAHGLNYEGSVVMDVDGLTIEAWFITKDGVVDDHWQISKGVDSIPESPPWALAAVYVAIAAIGGMHLPSPARARSVTPSGVRRLGFVASRSPSSASP